MAWMVVAFNLVLFITAIGVNGEFPNIRLAEYVKTHSDPDVPPMQDAHTPVGVSFQYAVLNIADADRKHNTVTLETYVMATWKTGIAWNPDDYGGVDTITLPVKYLWTPHMQPIDTAVEMKNVGVDLVMLYYTGDAYCERFLRIQSLCDVSHIRRRATCNSKTSLWGYSKDQVVVVDIRPEESGAIPYFDGSKYQILSANQTINDFPFDGKIYQIVDSWMTIQEKPGAYPGRGSDMFFSWY